MLEVQHLQICLAEPSALQAQVIRQLCGELGITQVDQVGSGKEALEYVRAHKPDVLISAFYLPDMTGTDLVYELRESPDTSALPFVLVSSETNPQRLDPVRQAGTMGILPKPFTVQQLDKVLTNTLDYLTAEDGEKVHDELDVAELHVLIVDDSPTARRHVRSILEKLGFERITEVDDGIAAIPLLDQTLFDLVVTDYNMPEVNGLQLVDHIRQRSMQSSVPIMMVSSEKDEGRISAVLDAGVSALCDKPFNTDYVRQTLRRILMH